MILQCNRVPPVKSYKSFSDLTAMLQNTPYSKCLNLILYLLMIYLMIHISVVESETKTSKINNRKRIRRDLIHIIKVPCQKGYVLLNSQCVKEY